MNTLLEAIILGLGYNPEKGTAVSPEDSAWIAEILSSGNPKGILLVEGDGVLHKGSESYSSQGWVVYPMANGLSLRPFGNGDRRDPPIFSHDYRGLIKANGAQSGGSNKLTLEQRAGQELSLVWKGDMLFVPAFREGVDGKNAFWGFVARYCGIESLQAVRLNGPMLSNVPYFRAESKGVKLELDTRHDHFYVGAKFNFPRSGDDLKTGFASSHIRFLADGMPLDGQSSIRSLDAYITGFGDDVINYLGALLHR